KHELPGVPIVCRPAGAVAAGFGLIALEVARAAASGADVPALERLADALAGEVRFYAFLDTLEYLARGGHVPRAAAWLGDLIGLRPVLTAPHGDVKRIAQSRSRRGATERLLQLVGDADQDRRPLQLFVMHADALVEAEDLR